MRRHQASDSAASTRPTRSGVRPPPPVPSAALVSHPQTASNVVQRAVADPASLSPSDGLALQRLLGNRATARLLGAAAACPPDRPRRPAIQAHLRVGSATDPAEREADRVADSVVGTRAAAAPVDARPPAAVQRQPAAGLPVGPEGGVADRAVEARLAARRGGGEPLPRATRELMEEQIGADFGAVRVHAGPDAQVLSRRLGAEAFAYGSDIYMGAGSYAPGTAAGDRLLAHELTHVVQQGAAGLRRLGPSGTPGVSPSAASAGIVRRKLAGVCQAVIQLGGKPARRSEAYAEILRALERYERAEMNYLNIRQDALREHERGDLFRQLRDLEDLVVAWLRDNPSDTAAQFASFKNHLGDEQATLAGETDRERQYHALTMVLPRIRHERREIIANRFYATSTWADTTNTAREDAAFGGQMNLLDRVEHWTRAGAEEGVFMAEKSFAWASKAGDQLGLATVDPNRGAHAVAMYQLAQLLDLGVDVIAKTEFATHTSATNRKEAGVHIPLPAAQTRMGVRMAFVTDGREAAKTPFTVKEVDAAQARANDPASKTISLEDPVLQRSLNALQLIDAIAGQLDRHWHNYYIAVDEQGHVLGVVGIDLDQAFAPDHRTVAPKTLNQDDPLKDSHFVGMPQLVDSAFAHRIVNVHPESVRELLGLYLESAEVDGAVGRFRLVQAACAGILERHEAILPGAWGADTARRTLSAGQDASYLGKMAAGSTRATFGAEADHISHDRRLHKRAAETLYAELTPRVEPFIWKGAITAQEALDLLRTVVDNVANRADAFNEQGQRAFLLELNSTAVMYWSKWLRRPRANRDVLRRCVGGAA